MKRVQMTTIAYAKVKELWTFEVPDDFDPAAHDPQEFFYDSEPIDGQNLDTFDEDERFAHEWGEHT